MNEKYNWGISMLTDEDLTSLKDAISQEEDKRKKGKRVKDAFEDFKNAAFKLDKLLDIDYTIEGEDYTMYGIICAVEDVIKEEGYPL